MYNHIIIQILDRIKNIASLIRHLPLHPALQICLRLQPTVSVVIVKLLQAVHELFTLAYDIDIYTSINTPHQINYMTDIYTSINTPHPINYMTYIYTSV